MLINLNEKKTRRDWNRMHSRPKIVIYMETKQDLLVWFLCCIIVRKYD